MLSKIVNQVFPIIERLELTDTANTAVEAVVKLSPAILVLLSHLCLGQDLHLLSTYLQAEVHLVLVEMLQDRLAQIFQSVRLLGVF